MLAKKSTNIYITIRKEKSDRHGNTPVLLAVSSNKKVRYINSGIKIPPDQFDLKNQIVINNLNSNEINLYLSEKKTEIQKMILNYGLIGEKPQKIIDFLYKTDNKPGIIDFIRQIIGEKYRNENRKTGSLYETTLNNMVKSGLFKDFADLNVKNIELFKDYLVKNEVGETSQAIYLRNIHLNTFQYLHQNQQKETFLCQICKKFTNISPKM
jgi:hypothetical protein